MKTYKQLNESLKSKDISYLFPNGVMNAYIADSRSDLNLLSVPDGERSNIQKINAKIKYSDYKDDTIVVLKSNDGFIYYWIVKEYGWELLNDKGREIASIPYNSVDLDDIYLRFKNV